MFLGLQHIKRVIHFKLLVASVIALCISTQIEAKSLSKTLDDCNLSVQITTNSPVFSGSSLQLNTDIIAEAYQWYGPNGFTSSLKNPVIENANTSCSGVYSLIVIKDGCSSNPVTANVTVLPANALTIVSTKYEDVNVCGNPGRIGIKIENESTVSQQYVLSNINISSDVLYGKLLRDGVDISAINATAVKHPLIGGETNLPISNITLNNGVINFTFDQSVTLKKCDYIQVVFYLKENCNVLLNHIESTDNSRAIASSVTMSIFDGDDTFTGTITEGLVSSLETYSLLFPKFKLNIAPTSKTISGNIGDHINRILSLSNSVNAGPASNFTLRISYSNSSIISPSNSIKLTNGNKQVTVTGVAGSNEYIFEINSSHLQALGLEASLENNESILLEETIDILSCLPENNSITKTNYSIEWGCADINRPVCNVGDANSMQEAFLNKKEIYPALTTTLYNKQQGTLCSNTAPGATVWIEIKNNGLADKDKAVEIKPKVSWQGINVSKINIINITSQERTLLIEAPTSGSIITINNNSDVDGAGGLSDVDANGIFNDLAKGATLLLEVEYTVPSCSNSCNGNERFIKAEASYYPVCSSILSTTNESELKDEEKLITSPSTNGPSDMMMGGEAKTISFTPQLDTAYSFVSTANTPEVTVLLPAGYILNTPSNATFKALGSGAVSNLNLSQNGQLVTLAGGGLSGTYNIDIKLTCDSQITTYGFDDVNWKLNLNSTDDCACNRTVACATHEIYRHLSATCGGGGGPTDPPFDPDSCNNTSTPSIDNTARTISYDANRTTFGYTQVQPNNTTAIWYDANINANTVNVNATTPGVDLKAAYDCDIIQVNVTGKSTPACYPVYFNKDVHIRLTHRPDPNGNALFSLLPNSSSFVIGNTTVSAQDPMPVFDMSLNLWVYDFVFPANPTFVVNNDNIQLTTSFSVNKDTSLPTNIYVNRFRGTVYSGNTYSELSESYGNAYHLYKPKINVEEKPIGSNSNFLCDVKRGLIFNIKGGSAADDFPNEFRSIAHQSKITYQLPANFNYVNGTAAIRVNGSSQTIALPDPIITGDITTGLNLVWNRNAGNVAWPLIDKQAFSNDIIFEFESTPTCSASPGGNFTATIEHTNFDYSTACQETQLSETAVGNNGLYYPRIDISANPQSTSENFIELPFTFNNVGNQSPYTWIAFEPAADAQIDNVYEVINGVEQPLQNELRYGNNNGSVWYKLGTVSPGSRSFKVKTSFTSCNERVSDAVKVYSGWNCYSYPTTPENFPQNTNYTASSAASCTPVWQDQLVYSHKTSFLLLSPITFDPQTKGICDATTFTVDLTCQDESSLTNLTGYITLPAGVTINNAKGKFIGLNVDPQTVNYSNLSVSPSSSQATQIIDINSILPLLSGENQLKYNEFVRLQIEVQPSCSYPVKNVLSFSANATSSCSKPIITSPVSKRIPILGFENLEEIVTTIVADPVPDITLPPTNVTIDIQNQSGFANTGEIIVTSQLPANITYNASVQGVQPSSVQNNPSGQLITWIIPVGSIAAQSTSTIKFNVQQGSICTNSNVQQCTFPITASTIIKKVTECSSTGNSCTIDIPVSDITSSISLFGCYTNVNVASNKQIICVGEEAQLTATGANDYSWNPVSTITQSNTDSSQIMVKPTENTVYTVIGTEANGCTATEQITVNVLTLNDLHICNSSIGCVGREVYYENTTPDKNGYASFVWNFGDGSASKPQQYHVYSSPGTYTVRLTANSPVCASNFVESKIVIRQDCNNPCDTLPQISITTANSTICPGQSTLLVANGGVSYSWNPKAGLNTYDNDSVLVTANETTTYVVTGINEFGCKNTDSVTISLINCCPQISVNSDTICQGDSTILTASLANSYLWSTGDTTRSIIVSPNETMNYTVMGYFANCSPSAVATVNVKPLPQLNVNSVYLCRGTSALLSASNAVSYLWSTGDTTSSIEVNPLYTASYYVTGVLNGCQNSDTSIVNVSDSLLSLKVNSPTRCSSAPVELIASGAQKYLWSTGDTTQTIFVSPDTTTSYLVRGDSSTCFARIVASVLVKPEGDVSYKTLKVCDSINTQIAVSGSDTYLWSTGSMDSTIVFATPNDTVIYVVGKTTGACDKKNVF